MSKTAAVLTIVVSAQACKMDNVDKAEVHRVAIVSVEECKEVAAALDPRLSVRAYCEEVESIAPTGPR